MKTKTKITLPDGTIIEQEYDNIPLLTQPYVTPYINPSEVTSIPYPCRTCSNYGKGPCWCTLGQTITY